MNYEEIQGNWQDALINLNAFVAALLGGSALFTLPRLFESLNELGKSLFYTRAKKLQELSSRPDFGDQIGIMDEIKKEIHTVSKLLKRGKGGHPTRLVLFIDDLDRCNHQKAVEVLQAIMLLLADEDGAPFVVFLGIDARVVVKAIEENYGRVLVEAGITGYEYLDKIIQIPFTIPPPPEKALFKFVDSLIWDSEDDRNSIEEVYAPQENDSSIENFDGGSSNQELRTANETEVAAVKRFEDDGIDYIPVTLTREERDVLKFYTAELIPNPRRIKRIINVYRFARLLVPEFTDEQRAKLIRWIILTEQWPFRTAWILQDIEDTSQKGGLDDAYRGNNISQIFEKVKPLAYDEITKKFLTVDNDPELFELFIDENYPRPEFLGNGDGGEIPPHVLDGLMITVDDIEGQRDPRRIGLRQLTFNLNPAIQDEVAKFSSQKLGAIIT